jgi:phosphoglycerate dehydrogenase-like enzyme
MKLVLAAARDGEAYYHLLDGITGLEMVRATTPADILEQVRDADALYGFPAPEIIAAAPRLRWIQLPSAGAEFVPRLPELVASDIVVTTTRGAHAPSVAEHVFALLLALTRCLPTCLDWQRQKHWGNSEGYGMPREIAGATLGIVGFGQLGRAVAKRARAFDLHVLALDSQTGDGKQEADAIWPPSRLPELLARSNIVVVTVPYTPETHHWIDARALETMRPGAYLVVVSRGGVVDEDALVASLRSGRLAGAALDVAEREPLPPESPLWELPNVILTPHVAGSSAAKERRCVEILRDNLIRYQNREPLLNVIDKTRGY